MQTMHPTLLIGPADWDAVRFPLEEFTRRLDTLWQDHPDAGGAIVYGSAHDHAALAYLTHFTPKLEAALALIPREGAPRLLIGGGANMVAAARPLTFIEDLKPLRGAATAAAEWARGLAPRPVVLIGGDAMSYDARRSLDAALGSSNAPLNGDDRLRRRMLQKSSRELAAIKGACGILGATVHTLEKFFDSGRGAAECVLGAEHTALQRGAQDVRSLFTRDRGAVLRPFETLIPQRVDPLQVYLAVRDAGYWAEAFVSLSEEENAMQTLSREAVDAMVGVARPNITSAELWQLVENKRGRYDLHELTQNAFGSSIGLALDEQPLLLREGETKLVPGAVYSLRAGFGDAKGSSAIASAMFVVTEVGHERLWPMAAVP